MSYSHVSVEDLNKPLTIDALPENDKEFWAWDYTLDGLPVTGHVQMFGQALRKKMPGIKFHASPEQNRVALLNINNRKVFTDVSVLMEGSPYRIGRIGHGRSFGVRKADEASFMVESRKINNEKYASWRDQYHRVFATKQETAVKQATKYLLPYTIPEMAEISSLTYRNSESKEFHDARTKLSTTLSSLARESTLLAEMRMMRDHGLKFVSPTFNAAMDEALSLTEAMDAEISRVVDVTYVMVRTVGHEQWCDCMPTDNKAVRTHDALTQAPVSSHLFGNLSEDMQGKLAVLATTETGLYVKDVGVRVASNAFWVEAKP